ncbi:hypothetical protein D3C77_233160 [compost metagenome]
MSEIFYFLGVAVPISIAVNRGNEICLSKERIKDMLSGNRGNATHAGLYEKVKAVIQGGSAEQALSLLFEQINAGNTEAAFDAFNKLSVLASRNHRALYTVDVVPDTSLYPDGSKISYCIDGDVVKADILTAEQFRVIQLKLGRPTDAQCFRGLITTLDSHERDASLDIQNLTDKDFKVGGVNKQFAPCAGVLKACSRKGNEDFKREGMLRAYAEKNPKMASYISSQVKIDAPEKVDQKFQYAKVTLYDGTVSSAELGVCFAKLSEGQVKSVSVQLIDMLKEFYLGKLSHLDLHMNNLIVHKRNTDNAVFLKAIDFGNAKFGDGFTGESYRDIDYIFNRTARSPAETLTRNHLLGAASKIMQKHYPLHKLLQRAGASPDSAAKTLSAVGKLLKADLQMVGDDEERIKQAFNRASEAVQIALDNAYHPSCGAGFRV